MVPRQEDSPLSCAACGADIEDDAKFCTQCGSPVTKRGTTMQGLKGTKLTGEYTVVAPGEKVWQAVAVVVGVVVVLLLTFEIGRRFPDSPVNRAASQTAVLKGEDSRKDLPVTSTEPKLTAPKGEISPEALAAKLDGLTSEQVVQMLGRPDTVSSSTVWNYQIYYGGIPYPDPDNLLHGFSLHDPVTDFYFSAFFVVLNDNGTVGLVRTAGESVSGKVLYAGRHREEVK